MLVVLFSHLLPQAIAEAPAPKALVDESKAAAIANGPGPMQGHAQQIGTVAEAREGLNKFIESMHQKAASLTSWISAAEPPSNPSPTDRSSKHFGWIIDYCCIFSCIVSQLFINVHASHLRP